MQQVFTDITTGKAFWYDEALPQVLHGPFLNESDAHDDIVEFNVAIIDKMTAIARVCHEVNRAFCIFIDDLSQLPWEAAPEWQRNSAIAGVQFHIDNPDAGDSASHDEWSRHKLAEGWVFGEVKDPEAKTHPCLVPFDQLPVEQQMKDKLFRETVHNLWNMGS